MTLPNAENAVIEIEKLRDYCLDPEHPRGKHKARVFLSALGLTRDDADALRSAIFQGVLTAECSEGEADSYGRRFTVEMGIALNEKFGVIRTGWIVKDEEDFPRLTTCFLIQSKPKK